jgi:hypothetical protein
MNKKIVIINLLLLYSLGVLGQLNKITTSVHIDEFSNDTTITTSKTKDFGYDDFRHFISGYVSYSNNKTWIHITYKGDLGCLSEYRSSLTIKLSSGDIVECAQVSNTDCNSSSIQKATFILASRAEIDADEWMDAIRINRELLRMYDWELVRLQGTEYYSDLKPHKYRRLENPEHFFKAHLLKIDNQL